MLDFIKGDIIMGSYKEQTVIEVLLSLKELSLQEQSLKKKVSAKGIALVFL